MPSNTFRNWRFHSIIELQERSTPEPIEEEMGKDEEQRKEKEDGIAMKRSLAKKRIGKEKRPVSDQQ